MSETIAKGVLEPSYKKRVGYQAMLVGGFSIIAAALLSIGDQVTRPVIEANEAADLTAMLGQVVPPTVHDNNLLEDAVDIETPDGRIHTVYRARLNGDITALAFRTQAPGYAEHIRLIMGVDRDGEVLGVRALQHAETPGLGDKIETAKSDWIYSFNGKSLDNLTEQEWAVKKDGGVFDQFTGATITPRRTVQAVHDGLHFFRDNRGAIMSGYPSGDQQAQETAQ